MRNISYQRLLRDQLERTQQEIVRFAQKRPVASEFEAWMKQKQRYEIANFLLNYRAYQVFQQLPRSDSLFDLTLFPVHDPSALSVNVFAAHLFSYASDRYVQRDSSAMAWFQAGQPIAGNQRALQLILEEEPPGLIRDLMIYRMLTKLMEASPLAFDTYWNEHPESLENPVLVEELLTRKRQFMRELNLDLAPLDPLEEQERALMKDLFGRLIKASHEQVVYVDLWAVWCGPCRREIPDWIELYRDMQGEGVAFWGLCCRSNRTDWSNLLKEIPLPGKQVFLEPTQVDILQQHLPFQGYPTYLILKDGKLVESSAARPSSGEEIRTQLRRYLNE